MGEVLGRLAARDLKRGEKQDPYWHGQSGLFVMRLLEQLCKYDQALKICAEMEKDFPGMRPGLRIRRTRLEKLQSGQP